MIGPYRLGKTLGAGSFSRVRLAVHEPTGEKVAVKVLNRQKLRRMEMGAKVRREIDVLKLFNHPHIVRLYEVVERDEDIYCVMEYVEGGEMFDYIVSRGRLDEAEARRMFQQVISGVEYAHSRMVVHRDLKPENILVDEGGHVKLADFGLANVMKDGQFLKTSCGSPNYAAPEVISGDLYAGPEVDVWSCGVILYALLCGSLPFDDDNIRSLFRKIKAGEYALPPHLSPGAVDLIRSVLVVDPVARARIADIRRHPWFRQALPPYLQQIADARPDGRADEAVVREAADGAGCGADEVREALRLAREERLLTSRRLAHCERERGLAVTYALLLDRRRREEISREVQLEVQQHDQLVEVLPAAARGRLTHGHTRAIPLRSRWYLGMWSALDPVTALQELCAVLRQLGLEWKNLLPFKLKARYIYAAAGDEKAAEPKVVKLGICMYRGAGGLYCVDVQKLHGELFPFFDLCSAIVQRLQERVVVTETAAGAAAGAGAAAAQAAGDVQMVGASSSVRVLAPDDQRARDAPPIGGGAQWEEEDDAAPDFQHSG